MTMLPDVDETGYDDWQNQLFQEDADRKIHGLALAQQANDNMASLSRIGSWANAPTPAAAPPVETLGFSGPPPQPGELQAAPEPAAPPTAADLTPAVASPAPAAAPAPSPGGGALSPSSAPEPSAAPSGNGLPGWFPQVSLPDWFPGQQQTPSSAPQSATPGGPLQDYARQAATRAGIDPDIFVRQIQQESGFNPNARSPAGATGVAQIVPNYHPGVDPTDPYASLDYAANLMKGNLGKYGGDYAKALAAYNAGAGNVDKYGGVPPFEETNRYVNTILGGQNPRQMAPAEGVGRAGAALGAGVKDISQFGDSQLTNDEAYAACGPAAAVRFAQRFGRNPSLREALDLAKSVGWTSAQGMAGLGSEKALMDKLGVATKLVSGPDWGTFANEARSGNPVTISTQGHYFTADGWDPQTNRFHVGRSGLDLKGGSEWMTPEQMTNIMGPVQGGLLADNPQVAAPSIADQESNPASWFDRTKQAMADTLAPPKPKTDVEVAGASTRPELSSITSPMSEALGIGEPYQQAAAQGEPQSLEPPRNPLEQLGGTIASGLRSLGIGGESSQPVNAPGGGYDPSSIRAVTEPPQPDLPLRQDVRDITQDQQPTIFDQASQTLGLDPASRAARQEQIQAGQDYLRQQRAEAAPEGPRGNLAYDVGQGAELGAAESRVETTADVRAGEALADTVVNQAKDAGWQPSPDEERVARTVLSQATPMNVLLSVAGGGGAEGVVSGSGRVAARYLAESALGLGLNIAGTTVASELAQNADLPGPVQLGAGIVGGALAQATGHGAITGATRAAEFLRTPEGQAALRAKQPARFSFDPRGAAEAAAGDTAAAQGVARTITYDDLGDVRRQTAPRPPPRPAPGSADYQDWLMDKGKWAPPTEPTASVADRIQAFMTSNMLLSPHSAFNNVVSQAEQLGRPSIIHALAGYPDEAATGLRMLVASTEDSFGNALNAWATGRASDVGENLSRAPIGVSAPGLRMNLGLDEIFRTMGRAQGMGMEAARVLAENPDLPKDVALRQNAPRINNAGQKSGAWSVFNDGPNQGLGAQISGLRSKLINDSNPVKQAAGWALWGLVPFSRIPETIWNQGILRTSPVNEIAGAGKFIKAFNAGDVRGMRLTAAETTLDSAINLYIYSQASQGHITAGDDPEHPWSIELPGDKWIDYRSLGPIATRLGTIASFVEATDQSKNKLAPNEVARKAQVMADTLDKTGALLEKGWFADGLIGFLAQARTGNITGAAAKQITQLEDRVQPAGALANYIEQATDPVMRDVSKNLPQALWERPQSRTPGGGIIGAQELPAKIDPTTGQPEPRANQGWLQALSGVQDEVSSPVRRQLAELDRKGYSTNAPPEDTSKITVANSEIPLSDDERRIYLTARGHFLSDQFNKYQQQYQGWTDDAKARFWQDMLGKSGEAGKAELINKTWGGMQSPTTQEKVRSGNRVVGRLQPLPEPTPTPTRR